MPYARSLREFQHGPHLQETQVNHCPNSQASFKLQLLTLCLKTNGSALTPPASVQHYIFKYFKLGTKPRARGVVMLWSKWLRAPDVRKDRDTS